jgi:signal transduction histidine kinase
MVEPAARVNGALWLALGVLATGLVIAALVQVFVGLSPLRTLRAALGRVRNGDAQRLEGEFPVEIAPLVGEFNSVLEQNAEVVQRARTQAGNLAHALKTPLSLLANAAAGGDGELARLVIAPRSMPRKNRCTTTWRGPRRLPGARTALRPVFERLLRTMRRIHAGRQLELLLHPLAESLAFRGEEQDLQEMLGNLLDNACKWATARVEIQASVDGENLMIRVDDDGQGIAAAARDAVLCRGVAPTSRCRDPGWACRLSTIWRSSTAANSDWPIRRSVACRQC